MFIDELRMGVAEVVILAEVLVGVALFCSIIPDCSRNCYTRVYFFEEFSGLKIFVKY